MDATQELLRKAEQQYLRQIKNWSEYAEKLEAENKKLKAAAERNKVSSILSPQNQTSRLQVRPERNNMTIRDKSEDLFTIEYKKLFAPRGPQLRAARMAKGLGLRRLAQRVGCSPTYVCHMELEHVEHIGQKLAEKIIKELSPAKVE